MEKKEVMTAKEYKDKWELNNGYSAQNEPHVYAEDYATYRMRELVESLTDEEISREWALGGGNVATWTRRYYLNKIKEGCK